MMILDEYKGYRGSVEYSDIDKVYWGRVLGIRDSITYDGETIGEAQALFEEFIDEYLLWCAEEGKVPERETLNKIRTTETTNNDIQLRRSYATI
jgi:predicted HicB family RNase H-like nuclease